MSALTKRSTIYLEPELHKALKLKSQETESSVSELINEALRAQLTEDQEDLEAFNQRQKEKSISFETFLKDLKRSGKI